ncbi:MAG: DegT/DnrJ/EryC1/StrS family aminotransferase [Eubacteriales bacterium]
MSKLAIFGGDPIRKASYPGWPRVGKHDEEGISEVYSSGKWSRGIITSELEEHFSQRTGVKHTAVVSNGTVSLEMILRGLDIGYGDEVILPAYTFIATLSSVLFTGASPVFADIDPETYNISYADAQVKITDKTRAIIAVAVGGLPPALDELSELAKKRGIHLIIDAAQAVGAKWNGKDIAGYGAAASFSCQNTKNLTSGEGGIITTDDDMLNRSIRGMLDGTHESYYCDNNVTEFQSSLLRTQLEKLDDEIITREHMASCLDTRISRLPFVSPMRRDKEVTVNAYHLYLMRFNSEMLAERGLTREMILRAIQGEGIPLTNGYMPLYTFPCVSSANIQRMTGRRIDTSPLRNCERASYLEGAWLYQSVLLSDDNGMDDIANALEKVWTNSGELAEKLGKELSK